MTFKGRWDGVAEYDRIFTAEDGGWGWETPVTRDPIPPGLMLDDTMVLKTRVRVLEVQFFHHVCLPSVSPGAP